MFSKTTEYALRATIYIAQKSSDKNKIGIEEISKAIDSPPSFTAKILQILTRESVISSIRGPNGGFYITDQAKQLPVRSILIAMNEDEVLNKCVLGLMKCSESYPCPMHAEYKSIKQQLIKMFESKTIQLLASKTNGGLTFINNIDMNLKVCHSEGVFD